MPAIVNVIVMVLQWGTLIALIVAFVETLLMPAQAFPAADRQSRVAWMIFIGLSLAVLVFFGLLSFMGLAAAVVAAVYYADVRPKVRAEAPAYRKAKAPRS